VAGAGAEGCGSGCGTGAVNRELGAAAGEGTTDCHVNSIFVLPCAATSFSQFAKAPTPPCGSP